MKRSHAGLFIAVLFVACFVVVGYWAWQQIDPGHADRAEIGKLHQADIAATLHANPDELAALWADDGVLLGQDEPAISGSKALRAFYAKDDTKVLQYTPHIQDLRIGRRTATEWGYFDATFQDAGKPPETFHGRFLRTMKKQKDGHWKFVRIMWQRDHA
ncbi:YybH family protein [Dyella silvatica]|uniref:YybH family protein n=1 Tax=Dyella silvatica TaxID=2992128 RepID=UPI0022533D8B|nr:nuclear transport factor 2 family protein [Dyella silvatica]